MLRGLHLAIIQTAALLVPAPERAEWLAEWRAELWYVNRRATAFCLGSFSDAFWMKRNTSVQVACHRFGLESPVKCLMFLAVLAALGFLSVFGPLSEDALVPPRPAETQNIITAAAAKDSDGANPAGLDPSSSPQNQAANPLPTVASGQTGQSWAPNRQDGYLGPLALCLLLLVIFSSVKPLSLGEYPVNRYAPAAPVRSLRWVFLAVKVALVVSAAVCGALALGPIAPQLAGWGCCLACSSDSAGLSRTSANAVRFAFGCSQILLESGMPRSPFSAGTEPNLSARTGTDPCTFPGPPQVGAKCNAGNTSIPRGTPCFPNPIRQQHISIETPWVENWEIEIMPSVSAECLPVASLPDS